MTKEGAGEQQKLMVPWEWGAAPMNSDLNHILVWRIQVLSDRNWNGVFNKRQWQKLAKMRFFSYFNPGWVSPTSAPTKTMRLCHTFLFPGRTATWKWRKTPPTMGISLLNPLQQERSLGAGLPNPPFGLIPGRSFAQFSAGVWIWGKKRYREWKTTPHQTFCVCPAPGGCTHIPKMIPERGAGSWQRHLLLGRVEGTAKGKIKKARTKRSWNGNGIAFQAKMRRQNRGGIKRGWGWRFN